MGMDPHKRSVTIEVAGDETVHGGGRFATDRADQALAHDVQRWPERVGAIEGCSGIGHTPGTLRRPGRCQGVRP